MSLTHLHSQVSKRPSSYERRLQRPTWPRSRVGSGRHAYAVFLCVPATQARFSLCGGVHLHITVGPLVGPAARNSRCLTGTRRCQTQGPRIYPRIHQLGLWEVEEVALLVGKPCFMYPLISFAVSAGNPHRPHKVARGDWELGCHFHWSRRRFTQRNNNATTSTRRLR